MVLISSLLAEGDVLYMVQKDQNLIHCNKKCRLYLRTLLADNNALKPVNYQEFLVIERVQADKICSICTGEAVNGVPPTKEDLWLANPGGDDMIIDNDDDMLIHEFNKLRQSVDFLKEENNRKDAQIAELAERVGFLAEGASIFSVAVQHETEECKDGLNRHEEVLKQHEDGLKHHEERLKHHEEGICKLFDFYKKLSQQSGIPL
jgi:hypothetical protein